MKPQQTTKKVNPECTHKHHAKQCTHTQEEQSPNSPQSFKYKERKNAGCRSRRSREMRDWERENVDQIRSGGRLKKKKDGFADKRFF